jgi:hypothetical protein
MVDVSRPQGLARLHALEWRYDGPIPGAVLAALAATPAALAARAAAADGAWLDRLARDSVRALAAARFSRGAASQEVPTTARLAEIRAIGLAGRCEFLGSP